MTNFVMAELAQPMHAFDRRSAAGRHDLCAAGEGGRTFVALNDEEYTLDPSNLVIADAAGPIAIAGVIGGGDSAISDEDYARGSGERQLPGGEYSQDVGGDQAAHRRIDAV